jgi:hypothetical protein
MNRVLSKKIFYSFFLYQVKKSSKHLTDIIARNVAKAFLTWMILVNIVEGYYRLKEQS